DLSLSHGTAAYHSVYVVSNHLIPYVCEYHIPNITSEPSVLKYLQRRYPEGFLPDFRTSWVIASCCTTAAVSHVPFRTSPSNQSVFVKYRFVYSPIIVLVSATVHVVMQNHVSRKNVTNYIRLV